ncbi:MAG: hypothetical protein GX620_09170 [Chloroflexi bacterium]|nr:hypothetical protein [Chloroflexota bacterium]
MSLPVRDNLTELGYAEDPLLDCQFHLFVEGKLEGVFSNLTGGEITVDYITHDVVFPTGLSTTLYIPGATSFSPFTLTRGFANYVTLYNWLMEASNGDIIQARRNGTIEGRKYGRAHLRWNFENAWPTKMESFGIRTSEGTQSVIARASITIVAETIVFEQPSEQ